MRSSRYGDMCDAGANTSTRFRSLPIVRLPRGDICVGARGMAWGMVLAKSHARTAIGGHAVYTPTLSGLGERVHLATPSVDLNTHIMDVVNVFHYEDIWDAVLVGHSYAGMVITGVASIVRNASLKSSILTRSCPSRANHCMTWLAPKLPPTNVHWPMSRATAGDCHPSCGSSNWMIRMTSHGRLRSSPRRCLLRIRNLSTTTLRSKRGPSVAPRS